MGELPGMRNQSLKGLRRTDHMGNTEPKRGLCSVAGLAWGGGAQVE